MERRELIDKMIKEVRRKPYVYWSLIRRGLEKELKHWGNEDLEKWLWPDKYEDE